MKNLLLILFLITPFMLPAQHSLYYGQRASLFEILPHSENDIIFLGNSITDGCEWAELFDNKNIKNRGIGGDIAQGVYDRLPVILIGKPAKIFLLIGINDVARGQTSDFVVASIEKIIDKL